MSQRIEVNMPDLPFAVEEEMSRLRINIRFCGKETRKILVTSSVPDEGKSFVTMHLWRMLAEAGFKTAVLDLDLRKSVLAKRHDMKHEGEIRGIDWYLSGQAAYEDVIYETNVENGFILPCSTPLENPSVLFEGDAFPELMGRLSEDFRFVLADTPPLVSVADGALVASHCDGALLVIRSGYASRRLVRQSVQQLGQVGCRLLGTVLNRVDTGARAYGYGYGYGYYRKGYGYGYGGYGYGRGEEEAKGGPWPAAKEAWGRLKGALPRALGGRAAPIDEVSAGSGLRT